MSNSNKSIKVATPGTFVCSWNDGEVVEIHTEESLKSECPSLFRREENTTDYDWCPGDDFTKPGLCFEVLIQLLASDDIYLLERNTNDNMVIVRIK